MRGATGNYDRAAQILQVFQSTLLMRGATLSSGTISTATHEFQSTLLMRGATWSFQLILSTACGFQSTLLMRGATGLLLSLYARAHISIHAPHARSDESSLFLARSQEISIHAPHARSDVSSSTPTSSRLNFNPRSSCEERRGLRKK